VPTYDYQCRACGTVTEVIHSMLEDGPAVCDRCGGSLRRVLFPTGIIFKGPGFYRNDSRASTQTSRGASGSEKPASTGTEGKSDSGSSSGESGSSGSTTAPASSES
jgi:putative FmdB family regulatory protein